MGVGDKVDCNISSINIVFIYRRSGLNMNKSGLNFFNNLTTGVL